MADARTPAGELTLFLIRLCDECSSIVRDKTSALFALAEAMELDEKHRCGGRPGPAFVGLRQVALETEEAAEELHERVEEALDMARKLSHGGAPEPEEPASERATLADVLDSLRDANRETVALLRDLAGRVAALEATGRPEEPAA